jgi:hypothetical protein
METLIEHFIPGVVTPIMLPPGYSIVEAHGSDIVYLNAAGERREHFTYLDHAGKQVIVDEFRNSFPHDSIIVVLYDKATNLYLHKRCSIMRWEPNKIDLASVAAQRRAVLTGDHYEAMDLQKLVLLKIADEALVNIASLDSAYVTLVGHHQNRATNEFQTIFAYNLEADIQQLNDALTRSSDPYKAQSWEKRPYATVIAQYFGEGVAEYAGGAELRPRNFISNPEIKDRLDALIVGK